MLGPASFKPESIERLVNAGVAVVHLNFSNAIALHHIEGAAMVRGAAQRAGCSKASARPAPVETVVGKRRFSQRRCWLLRGPPTWRAGKPANRSSAKAREASKGQAVTHCVQ